MPFTYQRDGRHHLAGCAEAALKGIVIDEGLLNRMEFAVLGKTLDRRHLRAFGRRGKNHTTVHASSVQMHSAGAAFTEIAAFLGARQLQVLAQQIEQCGARINWDLVAAAIDAQRDRQMRTKFHVLTPQRLAIFSANRSARVLFV
jgi:hypothetical protein